MYNCQIVRNFHQPSILHATIQLEGKDRLMLALSIGRTMTLSLQLSGSDIKVRTMTVY